MYSLILTIFLLHEKLTTNIFSQSTTKVNNLAATAKYLQAATQPVARENQATS